MSEHAVVATGPHAVAQWAPREDIRELAERIRKFLPGGEHLTLQEAYGLAQVALAHHLDPFNGEIRFLKRKDGTPIGLHVGINGHRRAGKMQLEAEGGGNAWCNFDGPLGPDELARLKLPATAIAYRVRLFDTRTQVAYTDSIATLLKAGAPWEAVLAIYGDKPFTEGLGIAYADEKFTQPIVKMAMKRAESDAYRRRFSLPFGDEFPLDKVPGGQFVVVGQTGVGGEDEDAGVDATTQLSEAELEERKARAERLKATLYPPSGEQVVEAQVIPAEAPAEPAPAPAPTVAIGMPEPAPAPAPPAPKGHRSWEPSVIQGVIAAGYAKNSFEAAGILNWSPFVLRPAGKLLASEVLPWCREYREGRDKGFAPGEAAARATVILAALASETGEVGDDQASR